MYQMLTDEELIVQVLPTQPAQCFELLYNRYVNKVYRRCLSMMHDSEQARDLTHDIFLRVFNRLEQFRHRASFSTWLYAITFNYCSDQLRLGKRFQQQPLESHLYLPTHDADDTWLHEMRLKSLRQGLERLSAQEQLLLKQKYQHDMSIQELTQLYGIGESAVKMRLKRSREKLQAACMPFTAA